MKTCEDKSCVIGKTTKNLTYAVASNKAVSSLQPEIIYNIIEIV